MESNSLRGLFGVSSPCAVEQIVAPQPTEPIENETPFEFPSGIMEKPLANTFTGDVTKHPDEHLRYVDDICGLFKLADIPDDVIKKKAFPLSLEGDALTWYRLCDDTRSWNYRRLKLEFHQKYYPMHLVHRDRNYIYNFLPREGESIAQAWGRLKSMLYSCPNHELSREIILQSLSERCFLKTIAPCSILLVLALL